jgi:hypothetical protein
LDHLVKYLKIYKDDSDNKDELELEKYLGGLSGSEVHVDDDTHFGTSNQVIVADRQSSVACSDTINQVIVGNSRASSSDFDLLAAGSSSMAGSNALDQISFVNGNDGLMDVESAGSSSMAGRNAFNQLVSASSSDVESASSSSMAGRNAFNQEVSAGSSEEESAGSSGIASSNVSEDMESLFLKRSIAGRDAMEITSSDMRRSEREFTSSESACSRVRQSERFIASSDSLEDASSIVTSSDGLENASSMSNVVRNSTTGRAIKSFDFTKLDDNAKRKMEAVVRMLNRVKGLGDEKLSILVNLVARFENIWKIDLDEIVCAKVTPLVLKLKPSAFPKRAKNRRYSREHAKFIAEMC